MRTLATRNKPLYRIILWVLLIVCIFALFRLAPLLIRPEILPSDDFVPYWASAKLNLHGENPYDPQGVEKLQLSAGGIPSGSYTISIILNPPWAISLLLPFGVLDYPTGRLIWLIFSTGLLLLSAIFLWQVFAGDPKFRWLAILAVFVFGPSISVLEVGQIGAIILVGFTGFLYFVVMRRNDWLAGVFIGLISIKPQIAVFFWIALLLWIIQQRRWRIIISAALTVFILTLIALIFNPHVIQQYLGMFRSYGISDWASPTIGAYLRFFLFGTDKFWLQFLPAVLGFVWIGYYWYTHRKSWDWKLNLPIVLLVSQVLSPYTWTYDQVILLPALIPAIIWLINERKRKSIIIWFLVYLGITILDLLLHMRLSDFWFLWMAPALLIWFLVVRWQYSPRPGQLPNQSLYLGE